MKKILEWIVVTMLSVSLYITVGFMYYPKTNKRDHKTNP